MLSIIAAHDKNRNIGLKGDMPWGNTMKADLQRFQKLTMGKPVIMGMNTYDSLPSAFKPLPNRKNVILTRKTNVKMWGPYLAHSIEEALALTHTDREVFVIGGAQIYEQFMPYADRIYLTEIHAFLEGDTKFPDIKGKWDVVGHSLHPADENNPYPYEYTTYERERG